MNTLAPLWYCETRSPNGRWVPQTRIDEPQSVCRDGIHREKRVGSIGSPIRAIGRVPEAYRHFNLEQLRELLAPDGLFISIRDPQPEATHATPL